MPTCPSQTSTAGTWHASKHSYSAPQTAWRRALALRDATSMPSPRSHPLPIPGTPSREDSFRSDYGSLGRHGAVVSRVGSWREAFVEALDEARTLALAFRAAALPAQTSDHPRCTPQAAMAPPLEAGVAGLTPRYSATLITPRYSLSTPAGHGQLSPVDEDLVEEAQGEDEKLSGPTPYTHEMAK